jgi:hypothetical protein
VILSVVVVLVSAVVVVGLAADPTRAHQGCRFLDETAVNGPCFVLSPSSGPIGTRVHFRVRVPPQYQGDWLQTWKQHPSLRLYKLSSDGNGRCQFSVTGQPSHWHLVRLGPYDPDAAVNMKAVSGWMTIGATGNCQGDAESALQPGRYFLSSSWRHGAFAKFRVTASQLPATGAPGRIADGAVLAVVLMLVGGSLLWKARRSS